MPDLFEPVVVGGATLAHRVAMAPLTRNRTQPSAVGQGYLGTPGLHTDAQQEGWRAVADAVHAEGGRIVVQFMHVGRLAHPDNKAGLESVAPSAIAAPGDMVTPTGKQPLPVPRALRTDELPGLVAEFVDAARRAVAAGLDGVELHAANGYLLHQFLGPQSNLRTDGYGGSAPNRARFVVEVARAVVEAVGGDKVGIRISPAHNVQGVVEDDADDVAATYGALVDQLTPLDLAYLHVLADPALPLVQDLRRRFGGPLVGNDGFGEITSEKSARALVEEDLVDVVAVGRPFLANPDLPRCWQTGAELNEPDPKTFYGGGAQGYTDYPALAE